MPTLGLIVNPVAGVGGRLGLHGSDDAEAGARALAAGAERVAIVRARRALAVLRQRLPELSVVAAPGSMGAFVADAAGYPTDALDVELHEPTVAADTRAAAAEIARWNPELLLFAGGDGTARDVVQVVGTRLPLLGIPSGVKMRSGVFATSPEAAGDAAARYLAAPDRFGLREAEVVDQPDTGSMEDSVLYGIASVPDVPGQLQTQKAVAPRYDDGALQALCDLIAEEMEPGRIYLLGPGTTTGRILGRLGLEHTPLGVDAVCNGALVGADLDEAGILELLSGGAPATLVLGVIGGQGFLLGRGNQQLTPRVLRRIGTHEIVIVAGADKLLALNPPLLRVDLGDEAAERLLDGYRQVRVGPDRSVMMRVASVE